MSSAPYIPSNPPMLTEEEKRTLVPTVDPWEDKRAYAIAYADYQKAIAFRTMNHDRRFRVSDELYLAWVNKKTWEGTRIPRASVSIFLLLGQIEALLPAAIGALFADEPPFDAEPMPGSTLAQARAVVMLLRSQLQNLSDEQSFLTLREVVRRTFKQSLIYGNGIIEVGWVIKQFQRMMYDRKLVAHRSQTVDPQGQVIEVPNGEFSQVVNKYQVTQNISKPSVQCIDIRDFYIDPNCSSPNVQDASFDFTRHLMTINAFKDLANGNSDIFVPPDDVLIEIAKRKQNTQGDQSKAQIESYRGGSWQPSRDGSTDPNLARIEIIRYWQKQRNVWFIPGYTERTIFNQPNPYGMLPHLNAFYIDVPSRFYGLSLCDLGESDQKLAEAILNARIDELNLMIHSPLVKKRGTTIAASQRHLRPGIMWEVDGDPKSDIIRMEMGNVTAQAFIEMDALERRLQKATGVTDFASLGTASAGGNSSLRTATGAGIQSAASGRRSEYIVENFEDQFMCPLLKMIHAMNQRFLSPEDIISVLGPTGQDYQIDPLDVLNSSVRFFMLASKKMKSKQALLGGGMQMIAEMYLNPALQGPMLQQRGLVLDTEAFDGLMMDMMGLPTKSLWRQASQQEIQAANQPSADQQLRMQMQQERLQSVTQNQGAGDETKLLITLLQKIITPDAAHEALGLPPPAAIEAKHAPPPAKTKAS